MEDAGVHSGDATLMFPAQTISQGALEKVSVLSNTTEEQAAQRKLYAGEKTLSFRYGLLSWVGSGASLELCFTGEKIMGSTSCHWKARVRVGRSGSPGGNFCIYKNEQSSQRSRVAEPILKYSLST